MTYIIMETNKLVLVYEIQNSAQWHRQSETYGHKIPKKFTPHSLFHGVNF